MQTFWNCLFKFGSLPLIEHLEKTTQTNNSKSPSLGWSDIESCYVTIPFFSSAERTVLTDFWKLFKYVLISKCLNNVISPQQSRHCGHAPLKNRGILVWKHGVPSFVLKSMTKCWFWKSRHSGFAENTQETVFGKRFCHVCLIWKGCRPVRRHLRYLRFGSQVTRGEGFYGTPLAQSGDRSLLRHFKNVCISLFLIIF
jgi:hypothetical protein